MSTKTTTETTVIANYNNARSAYVRAAEHAADTATRMARLWSDDGASPVASVEAQAEAIAAGKAAASAFAAFVEARAAVREALGYVTAAK